MQTLLNYALKYAEKGFYVLPIAVGDKSPLIEFADRPALNADDIKKAWRLHPNAGIAFRTVDFFVVDIDRHTEGADGVASFKKYVEDHTELFPETLSQTTGHGGIQIFYKKPAGADMTQVIGWLPGVDIKAHINNYCLVAPSNGYQWNNKNPIAEAPAELVEAVQHKAGHKVTASYTPNFTQETLSDAEKQLGEHSKTAELFEEVVNGLGETGGRNMALTSFIGGLLFRNVNVKAVYELAKLANDHTPKSLGTNEFDRTFDSMMKKEMRRRDAGKQQSNESA